MADLNKVFEELRELILPYALQLDCKIDRENELSVNTRHIMKNGNLLWFGGVQINKNYVSYHLMPVYINPHLLENISPALKKRMQGKSCFNFTSLDESLVKELADLTNAAFQDYHKRGYVQKSA